MGGKRSRGKGQRGERELVRWFQPLLPDGWQVRRALPYEHGHDLRFVASDGSRAPGCWAVEVKRYADWSVGEVMRGPSQRWLDWWRQTSRQADAVSRAPMLCCRGDRRPWWLWTRHAFPVGRPYVELVLPPTAGMASAVVCGTLLEQDAVADLVRQSLQGAEYEWACLSAGAAFAGAGRGASRGAALGQPSPDAAAGTAGAEADGGLWFR